MIVSPAAVGEALALAIRLHCKVRRKLTITDLAGHAGMSPKRLQKIIDNDPIERRAPSAAELLSLLGVLGPDAASSVMALIGMRAADFEDEQADALGHLAADVVRSASSLVLVASDGKVSPNEISLTEEAADEIMEKCRQFKAAARRARAGGGR